MSLLDHMLDYSQIVLPTLVVEAIKAKHDGHQHMENPKVDNAYNDVPNYQVV